jgi:target of rapamycin complex subunit LST8
MLTSRRFATCSADKTVKIYSIDPVKGFEHTKTLIGHTKWVWDCQFLQDSNKIITVSSDGFLKVWDITTGNLLKSVTQHMKAVICCALHDRPLNN